MFLLDTNVLSEFLKLRPNPAVVSWFNQREPPELATASVCVFEVRGGLRLMPAGRRRTDFLNALAALETEDLRGGVLALGESGADAAAELWVDSEKAGRPVETLDHLIAGTAIEHGATVVTRNTKHFQHAGVPLVNPWEA